MTSDAVVLGAIALAGFLIGFGKAGVAGAMGPFVTVLMALVLPADEAIGLLLPMMIIGDAFSLAATWGRWRVAVLRPLLLSGLAGIALGSVLLSVVDGDQLRRLIAVVMLLFIGWYGWSRRPRVAASAVRRFGWASGLIAGFTSTVAHAGGPPLVVFLMSVGLEPATLVATTVVFFAAVNLLKVPGYITAGVLDMGLIVATLWAWITIPAGVWVGRQLVDRIDTDRFERLIVVLLAAGTVLLFFR